MKCAPHTFEGSACRGPAAGGYNPVMCPMKTGFDWIGTTYGSLIQVASMVWLFGSTSVVGFLGRRWLRAPAPPTASE